jgi:hypothetical protein
MQIGSAQLGSTQLTQLASIVAQIEKLQADANAILGGGQVQDGVTTPAIPTGGNAMQVSAPIIGAANGVTAGRDNQPQGQGKRTLSKKGRANIRAAQIKRWAAVKAAKTTQAAK